MSVTGVGSTNSLANAWLIQKARSEDALQKASASAAAQQATAGAPIPVAYEAQSVTGASGPAINPQDASAFGQSMAALTQAVQDGDVGAAQDAFNKVKSLLQGSGVQGHHHHHHGGAKPAAGATANPASVTGAEDSTDPFTQAFGAIGQAVQSGDLPAAQNALDQLGGLLKDAVKKPLNPPAIVDRYAAPGGAIDRTA